MTDEPNAHGNDKDQRRVIDASSGINVAFFPLPDEMVIAGTSCAGKPDNTPCDPGCVFLNQQRHYTIEELLKMGFVVK